VGRNFDIYLKRIDAETMLRLSESPTTTAARAGRPMEVRSPSFAAGTERARSWSCPLPHQFRARGGSCRPGKVAGSIPAWSTRPPSAFGRATVQQPSRARSKSTMAPMSSPSTAVHTELRALVDDYRDRCLWFLRRDYYPTTIAETQRVLDAIQRHGDREAFRRAARVRLWLSQPSSATSVGS